MTPEDEAFLAKLQGLAVEVTATLNRDFGHLLPPGCEVVFGWDGIDSLPRSGTGGGGE